MDQLPASDKQNKTKLPTNKISGPDGCTEAFYQNF